MNIERLPDTLGTSVTYPQAQYQVQCPKHGKWVTFQISHVDLLNVFDPNQFIRFWAQGAIDTKCPGCIQEQNEVKLPPTRWPNAGEPGGAEL